LKSSERRIVVYTAIFDAYDAPPAVRSPDPTITYALYTDGSVASAPPPWQVRPLPRIFLDPQRDARRIKLLPHLVLPADHVSVWVDANCELTGLDAESVLGMLGDAELALPAHEERSCLYEEAKAVLAGPVDSPARVARQILAYRSAGFPANAGLHATMFLLRRHNEPGCRRFCEAWWQQVCQYSKRDQISFDYIRWLHRPKVRTLRLRYTANPVFSWGARGHGGHRRAGRVTSEHLTLRVYRDDLPGPTFLGASYWPHYDFWPTSFLRELCALNAVVARAGERLEGNLCYFDGCRSFLHSPPDPRRGARRDTFIGALAGRRRLFEIGFNGGHSTLLALTHGEVSVTAIDISRHAYTEMAAAHLARRFPGRLRFKRIDSRSLREHALELELAHHDLVHVDGGHGADVYENDITTVLAFCRPGTLVLVDDVYVPHIRAITGRLLEAGRLASYGDLATEESQAFEICAIRSNA